ncbi:type II secretion system F family protein [Tardisphaera miroshnichenkoae]
MKLKDLFKKKVNITIQIGEAGTLSEESPGEAPSSEAEQLEAGPSEEQPPRDELIIKNKHLVSAGTWSRRNMGFLSFLSSLVRDYVPELKKAGIYVDEQDFMAFWSVLMFVGAVGGFFAGFMAFLFVVHDLVSALILATSAGLIGFSLGLGVPLYYVSSKKSSRKAELEAVLPFIVERFASYIEAGAPLKELINSFKDRHIYGIWIDEVNEIRKEIDLLGISPSEAIMNAAKRSPSDELSNFLSSFVLSTKSSVDLRPFINHERENIMNQKRLTIDKFLENLGALTESVISLFVILPITILTMGMIAATIGGGFFGLNPTALILVTSFVIMPLMFLVAMESVSSITPRMRRSTVLFFHHSCDGPAYRGYYFPCSPLIIYVFDFYLRQIIVVIGKHFVG